MEYNDQEYLSLFKKIQNKQNTNVDSNDQLNNGRMLKENYNYNNYSNYNNYNINEVNRNTYNNDLNLNEFNIETRINGQNINEVRKQEKEDKLNEVMKKLRDERLKEAEKIVEDKKINETVDFKSVDVVTLDIFNKARYNSMMKIVKNL